MIGAGPESGVFSMKNRIKQAKHSILAPGLIILLLAGCAGQPEKVTFADIAAKNETLKITYPERVILALDADCDDEGMCTLPESNIQKAVDIVTLMNDEAEKRIDAYNQTINGLSHCEYANAKKDEAIAYMESASMRSEITGTVKQVLLGLTCAGLLIAQ